MEIFLEKKNEVPKSAQEETEKLTRSIATKESENPRETTDRLLEGMGEFSTAARYTIIAQKATVFLCSSQN